MTFTLQQGPQRGFFSNLTTLLTCSRFLVEQQGANLNDIFINTDMFSLYGDPKLWFDSQVVSDNGQAISSLVGFDLSMHPTSQQLDLSKYLTRFAWNNRVRQILASAPTILPGCVGIHYRGTDHNVNDQLHGLRVNPQQALEIFYQVNHLYKANQVFICSDEQDSLEYLIENIKRLCGFDVVVNNATRLVNSNQGLHWQTTCVDKTKIADEVILDAWCLSKCQVLIGKTSNLINFARILNPQVKVFYTDLHNSASGLTL